MKIDIRKEILLQMFTKLYCNNIFPFSIITNKNGCISSIQTDEKHGITRWFSLPSNKYKLIEKGDDFTIKVDNKKLIKFISPIKAKKYVTLEFPVIKKHEDLT